MLNLKTGYRSHTCGELNQESVGADVTLCGWVAGWRNLGGVIFIDLRDRWGVTQITFDPKKTAPEVMETAKKLRYEFVIQVKGKVNPRPENARNLKMATGEIEIMAVEVQILSKSETPPFLVEDNVDASEELRLEYRYLDLRRPVLKDKIILRHKVTMEVRKYLDKLNFI
jgi:aspartyl-tRNA synthetase